MPDIKIYTTPMCGYCHAARRLLDDKGIVYENIDVGSDPATRAWLRETTGRHTVPQIFIDGEAYGGYTELAALDASGDLDALLGDE